MASILVIDDDPQVRTMLREMLEEEGYHILDAPDGQKGLALYSEQAIDLVITDLIMPDKEGLQTIRELRKINPEVKIITISGGGRVVPKDYLEYARKLGSQRVFKKPLNNLKLLAAIEELLEVTPG